MASRETQEIVDMLNKLLEDERGMMVEYATYGVTLRDPETMPFACATKCFIKQECKHSCKLMKIISYGFNSCPSMKTREPGSVPKGGKLSDLAHKFLDMEKDHVNKYREVRSMVQKNKDTPPMTMGWERIDYMLMKMILGHEKHMAILAAMSHKPEKM